MKRRKRGSSISLELLILSIALWTTTLVDSLKFLTTPVTTKDDSGDGSEKQQPHKRHQWLLRSTFFDPRTIVSKEEDDGNTAVVGVCTGYSGILKIDCGVSSSSGGRDDDNVVGFEFFSNVVNQIRYAERNNLIPWVHFSSARDNGDLYDGAIHDATPLSMDGGDGSGDEEFFYFDARVGTTVTKEMAVADPDTAAACGGGGAYYPGPPDVEWSTLRDMTIVLDTSGVWDYYFKPATEFHPCRMTPDDFGSCSSQPFVELPNNNGEGVSGGGGTPLGGMFCHAPWALHPLPYSYLPEAARPSITTPTTNDELHDWFLRTRREASRIVNQYYHPHEWLKAQVDVVNPIDEMHPCLALHIRRSTDDDEADNGGRTMRHVDEFLPYAKIYAANRGSVIYVASDTADDVWDHIRKEWPEHISRLVRLQKRRRRRSGGDDDREEDRHARTRHSSNHLKITRVLIDIYAMSRCALFVHGYSVISEAVVYVNFDLHHWSVNLDYPHEHMELATFENMVRERVPPDEWR